MSAGARRETRLRRQPLDCHRSICVAADVSRCCSTPGDRSAAAVESEVPEPWMVLRLVRNMNYLSIESGERENPRLVSATQNWALQGRRVASMERRGDT